MPIDFNSSDYNVEVPKISHEYAWIRLIEVEYETGSYFRLTDDNQDIVYNGETYSKFPIEIGNQKIESNGAMPSFEIRVGNANRYIESIIASRDGLTDKPLKMVIGQRNLLEQNKAAQILDFIITESSTDNQWAYFTLKIPNISLKLFPSNRFLKNSCPYEYGGLGCSDPNVSNKPNLSTYPTCDRTFSQCQERGNSDRFGGYPGIVYGALTRANSGS